MEIWLFFYTPWLLRELGKTLKDYILENKNQYKESNH